MTNTYAPGEGLISDEAREAGWNAYGEKLKETASIFEALDAAYSAAAPHIIAAHEARKWQPIDGAPTDGTPVLLGWTKGFFEPSKGHYEPCGWGVLESDMSFHVFDDQPDCFQLLPPLPLLTATSQPTDFEARIRADERERCARDLRQHFMRNSCEHIRSKVDELVLIDIVEELDAAIRGERS